MKRPSIFKQQKFNLDQVYQYDNNGSQNTLNTINSKSTINYIHTQNNLSHASTKMCISIPSTKATGRKCSVDSNDMRSVQLNNIKTQTCKFWQSGMQCPYANNCRFAHGEQQKRLKEIEIQNYRTKICKNFFEKGSCNYGCRCQFLHQKNPYERQRQFYRKRMSQIHKDTDWFFLNQKRLNVMKQLDNLDDKQNTPTPPSSTSNISSNNSIKKIGQKSAFSLSEYCKSTKKGRHFSICL